MRLQTPEELPSAVPHIVVGLGASAGGIRALKDFFKALPPKSDMAFVVVLHLSPEHESKLDEVLQGACSIPVTQVRARTRIEPDHVYVVSPKNTLSLLGGHIEVVPIHAIAERRAPVDIFFRALAEAQRARAVSVILSGTGANGSMGMKRVKECGGVCIVQEPDEADFADMPRNAIATGLVDYVLPAAEIPPRLVAYRDRLQVNKLPTREDPDLHDQALIDIFALLRVRTGHDFANYKRSTLLRRLERRLNVQEVYSLADYVKVLRENREEASALLRDLLISVTNFFRDSEAWQALERTVIPKLFENKGGGNAHVRVWVPGCATGEEAYSVAILLAENTPDPIAGPTLQVFATDIDKSALAKARAGLYTLNDAADVSPDRLRRFFLKDGDAYRVRRELREMVLFAPHNVINDPPFSHLDLITCRNVLIYLNRVAQDRLLRLFHFGLNPGGYLFLGNSESADDSGNMFVTVSKEHHIFQSRSIETPLTLPESTPGAPLLRTTPEERPSDKRMRERLSYQELHQLLLERYAPPSVIVSQDFDILHLSDHAGRYLQFVGGEPSQNLLKVVRPELRFELHSALYHAVQNRTSAEAIAGPVQIDGKSERVRLLVSPVFSELDTSRGMILILFEALEGKGEARTARIAQSAPAGEPIARHLEEELLRLKLQLRTTIEQYELQQEELKASNEELQAMNEELRSSSEELETSKEELQSVNEELTTVNQELKIKIDELSEANNDTRNLMNSTDIATVFIDRGMRIKLFTPRALSIFNLIPTDGGRSLLDITNRLEYPELAGDIERVLEVLGVSEREVRSVDAYWYIARVVPYRTADDRIAGVVLTFTDITERKRVEEALRASEERIRSMIASVPDFAILTTNTEGKVESWNSGARDMFGYSEREAIGRHVGFLFLQEDVEAGVPQKEMDEAIASGRASDERWHLRKNGTRVFVSGVMSPLVMDGKLVGFTKVARDLTQREKNEQELRAAREQLEAGVAERTQELAKANAALRREIQERTQSEEKRVHLLRQLLGAQEDERRRISRELHDQLGQEISALGLKLSALEAVPNLHASAQGQIEVLKQLVQRLDSGVDFLVWELRPTGLDDLGLREGLSDYIENWSKNFGIRVRLHAELEQRPPSEVETVLYRIAQEALNNIAKHAAATEVDVELLGNLDSVSLTIRDNGKGFDTTAPYDQRAFGLQGMRERAALVNGEIKIESMPGAGSVIEVQVPV